MCECMCVYICISHVCVYSLLPGNNDNYVKGNHSIILLHAK